MSRRRHWKLARAVARTLNVARNGTKRGRPITTIVRETSRARRRHRSHKTARANYFRFASDVIDCRCRREFTNTEMGCARLYTASIVRSFTNVIAYVPSARRVDQWPI